MKTHDTLENPAAAGGRRRAAGDGWRRRPSDVSHIRGGGGGVQTPVTHVTPAPFKLLPLILIGIPIGPIDDRTGSEHY